MPAPSQFTDNLQSYERAGIAGKVKVIFCTLRIIDTNYNLCQHGNPFSPKIIYNLVGKQKFKLIVTLNFLKFFDSLPAIILYHLCQKKKY